jgi:Na+/pantothenate symporter
MKNVWRSSCHTAKLTFKASFWVLLAFGLLFNLPEKDIRMVASRT